MLGEVQLGYMQGRDTTHKGYELERGQESPQGSRHCLALSRGAPVAVASNCEADNRAYGEKVRETWHVRKLRSVCTRIV